MLVITGVVLLAPAVGWASSAQQSAAALPNQRHAATPTIIGGEPVASAPWAAGLYEAGEFNCSGAIIAARWVLTAKHCTWRTLPDVFVGDVRRGQGVHAKVAEVVRAPTGDVALLHLSTPVETTYAQLADADPAVGSVDYIYGWGNTGVGEPPSDVLKRAAVTVTGRAGDFLGGPAIETKKLTGTAGSGDSGGPQFHGDQIVGVCSTGNNVYTRYSSIAYHRAWIRSTTGV
jgi:hypothetical protein